MRRRIYDTIIFPTLHRVKRLCDATTDLVEEVDILLRRLSGVPGFTDEEVLRDTVYRLRREFGDQTLLRLLDQIDPTARDRLYPN